ncbi:MAG: glutathione S-transferase N-terminal domain-containing protein [Actinomycetota bacterium]|nr:glutathione S-transferase N-terminal domain-containing protein [Actinomycetota bacterium]
MSAAPEDEPGQRRPPVLWQYTFSNFNEKARWALDYKGIPHVRSSLFPGGQRALRFSRTGTVPVLDLGAERVVDSPAIIAALEPNGRTRRSTRRTRWSASERSS